MRLEAQRGEMISKKIEDNLSKLMVTCEAQIKKPNNEVQTQTQTEVIEGQEYFKNIMQYSNPHLTKISQRLYDQKIYNEEIPQKTHNIQQYLPPIAYNNLNNTINKSRAEKEYLTENY